jgi:ribosomal protein L40E
MSRSMGMSAFLGHETRSGGSSFLKGWRKRNPPQVDVVLHTEAPIVALWQHSIPRIYEQKDEKTNRTTRRVFSGNFNCLEDESVLLKQYRRDRQTGERTLPPVLCPTCRLMEALYALYQDGEIGFADTVFRWEGDDPNETQELSVGGMLNLYGKDNLTDEEKDAMHEAGVKLSEAWKENAWAKCNYLFVVVDSADPESGVQLAIETTALGDSVKECIKARIESEGEEDGNPMLNPYAIRWKHVPNAKEFSKRYQAIAMPRIEIVPKVRELIQGDPPDTSGVTRPGNVTKLRADLETHCVLDDPSIIPWDDIFGPAERAGYGQDTASDDVGEEAEEQAKAATKAMASKRKGKGKGKAEEAEPAKASRRRKKVEPEPEPEPEEEEEADEEEEAPSHEDSTIPCDECGATMAADAVKCEKCGAEYELEDDEAEEEADEEEDEEEAEEEEEEEEAPPPPAKKASKKASKKAPAKKAPAKGKGKGKIPF